MSSAAGIPTGWQVVQDLIRKVAICEGIDKRELGGDPEIWWGNRFGVEPRYDKLLATLAPTEAARQALLRDYFDPPASSGGPIQPREGHRALAELCARGRVRVVLTTNFDRLLERALDDAGVGAQVIATADDLNGMAPLVHRSVTLVKLHGDYAGTMRNTAEDLAEYPEPLRELISRVFDEYGLLTVGWSADYDVALGRAISACPTRRYPTYWTSFRGELTETARRLIDQRQGILIGTEGADEFFVDLSERIARLDQRAIRRGRPTPLRSYSFPPQQSSTPEGWAACRCRNFAQLQR